MDVNVRSIRTSSSSSGIILPHCVFSRQSFGDLVLSVLFQRRKSPSTTSRCDLIVLDIHAVLLQPGIGHSAS